MEDKACLINKQVDCQHGKKKRESDWLQVVSHLINIDFLSDIDWLEFSWLNHLAGVWTFFEARHLSLFEPIVLNGPTIAAIPVAVFGQHAQSGCPPAPLPLWKHKGLLPPSPEGHYFWLWPQGQPADLPKGRGPCLAAPFWLCCTSWVHCYDNRPCRNLLLTESNNRNSKKKKKKKLEQQAANYWPRSAPAIGIRTDARIQGCPGRILHCSEMFTQTVRGSNVVAD